LAHSQRDALLDALADLRQEVRPLLTVLRTNLALSMDDNLLRRIAHSTDEVVVSVDGDRHTHDERRGTGQFDATVSSLHKLVEMGCTTDLSLATGKNPFYSITDSVPSHFQISASW
jgi:MoaA/NifB/PqqE/SkfB family radical SAM enzyme